MQGRLCKFGATILSSTANLLFTEIGLGNPFGNPHQILGSGTILSGCASGAIDFVDLGSIALDGSWDCVRRLTLRVRCCRTSRRYFLCQIANPPKEQSQPTTPNPFTTFGNKLFTPHSTLLALPLALCAPTMAGVINVSIAPRLVGAERVADIGGLIITELHT